MGPPSYPPGSAESGRRRRGDTGGPATPQRSAGWRRRRTGRRTREATASAPATKGDARLGRRLGGPKGAPTWPSVLWASVEMTAPPGSGAEQVSSRSFHLDGAESTPLGGSSSAEPRPARPRFERTGYRCRSPWPDQHGPRDGARLTGARSRAARVPPPGPPASCTVRGGRGRRRGRGTTCRPPPAGRAPGARGQART